jgi:hypothetical protein
MSPFSPAAESDLPLLHRQPEKDGSFSTKDGPIRAIHDPTKQTASECHRWN